MPTGLVVFIVFTAVVVAWGLLVRKYLREPTHKEPTSLTDRVA